jgi:hypothetical protein
VRYRFFNNAPQDVTTLVAFPMPEIVIDHPDTNISIPTDDPENILGFTTLADDRPVATRVEQRVLANGIDRTELLRRLGVPLAPHLRDTTEALGRLAEPARQQLLKLGLVEIEEYDRGEGMKKHLEPRWALQTTHYWEQTFPSRRELVIEHRYKPSVGTLWGRRPRPPNTGRDTASIMICSEAWSGRDVAPRGISCLSPSSASNTSSQPALTGQGRYGSSVSWSTRATPGTS